LEQKSNIFSLTIGQNKPIFGKNNMGIITPTLNFTQKKETFMKTNVLMERDLTVLETKFGIIHQRTKDGYLSLTDLLAVGNKYRAQNGKQPLNWQIYKKTKQAKEFIAELESMYGKVYYSSHGRGKHSWVHPFLFIDVALNIDPKFKIIAYKWVYDRLIELRNASGDSYKLMVGSLWKHCNRKDLFPKAIKNLALRIKKEIGVESWERASQEQLRMRDDLHEEIATIASVVRDNKHAVDFAFATFREKQKNKLKLLKKSL
jgi:hypothetical protein